MKYITKVILPILVLFKMWLTKKFKIAYLACTFVDYIVFLLDRDILAYLGVEKVSK